MSGSQSHPQQLEEHKCDPGRDLDVTQAATWLLPTGPVPETPVYVCETPFQFPGKSALCVPGSATGLVQPHAQLLDGPSRGWGLPGLGGGHGHHRKTRRMAFLWLT